MAATPTTNESYKASSYSTSPIRASSFALVELLRAQVTKVNNKVFPPGIRQDSTFPRITVSQSTPRERRWIGESYGTGKGILRVCTFKVDVWDKSPSMVDEVADDVIVAIWNNRGYHSTSIDYGAFINLTIDGGSETTLNNSLQVYQRTVIVSGLWLHGTVNVPNNV